jgi:hypothetical protein
MAEEKKETDCQQVVECLICDNPAKTRGLCQQCYNTAASCVKTGKSTWEALEASNLALPSKKNVKESKFMAAFKSLGCPGGRQQQAEAETSNLSAKDIQSVCVTGNEAAE